MTTITTQNGISITFNGKSTYTVLAQMEFGTSSVVYGVVTTERKALNLLKKVLKYEGVN
tara:strand:+ start:2818 stop:2994 length:177 start_codon:yes stop_codon:yes gene_type:complete